jgi:tRNA A37 methylthiotransferase MiaB
MGRATQQKTIRKIMDKIREKIPDMSVRTELIVGFPGENSEKFEKLLRFVEEYEFDWLGVFVYSPEPGTPSFKMYLDEIGINDGISDRTQWFLEESYIREFQLGDVDDVMYDDRYDGSEDEGKFSVKKSNEMEMGYRKDLEGKIKSFFVEAESKKREVMELWSRIFARKQMERVGKVFRCIFEGGRTFRAYFQAPEVDGVVRVRKGLDVRNLSGAFHNIKIVGVDGADLIGEIV